MDPSGIHLARTYRFGTFSTPERPGEKLWQLLAGSLPLEIPEIVVDRDNYDFVRLRFVDHLHARLVARGTAYYKRARGLDEETVQDGFVDIVEATIRLAETPRARAATLLLRICRHAAGRAGKLTGPQHERVAGIAARGRHRCYICGTDLDFRTDRASREEAASKRNGFEADHVFPRSKGGEKEPENFAAICENCNKLKADKLCYADFGIELVITGSSDPTTLRKAFEKGPAFHLAWRQQGRCGTCSRSFYEIDDRRTFLNKRDEDDTFHFMNAIIECGECATADPLSKGVIIRDHQP